MRSSAACENKFNIKEIVMTAKLKPTIVALALMLAVCLLFSSAALAQGNNCPPEPAQGTPIADGEIYIGANCTLQSPGDVDGFVFSGNNGETYHTVLAINGSAPTDICLTLYNPSAMVIFSGCTNVFSGRYSVLVNQALTVTGPYTIDVTETGTATISYALSLERLYPFPPNAQQIMLATRYPGDITPITDSNAFTFESSTTGTEQVSATLTGSPQSDLCMDVYLQDGTHEGTEQCTNIFSGRYTIQISFTVPQNGTSMAFFQVAGNNGTVTYTMEVSCIVGMCGTSSIPDVSGYIILQGVPLAGAGVSLTQPGAPSPQLTMTNSFGYYQFLHAIAGADFTVQIKGPVVPQDSGTPASRDSASPETVDKDPLK
jgi:hypothetical protein